MGWELTRIATRGDSELVLKQGVIVNSFWNMGWYLTSIETWGDSLLVLKHGVIVN